MNSIWIATHADSPDDTALSVGHTAEEAAALLSDKFPRCSVFLVGRAEVGKLHFPLDDALKDRSVVRRQRGGDLIFTSLEDGKSAWSAF